MVVPFPFATEVRRYVEQQPGRLNRVGVQVGIFARRMTRAPKDIRGATFPVEFKLVDTTESPDALAAAAAAINSSSPGVEFKKPAAPYAVKVLLTVRPPCVRGCEYL